MWEQPRQAANHENETVNQQQAAAAAAARLQAGNTSAAWPSYTWYFSFHHHFCFCIIINYLIGGSRPTPTDCWSRPFSPLARVCIFIAHTVRVQHSHCSSITWYRYVSSNVANSPSRSSRSSICTEEKVPRIRKYMVLAYQYVLARLEPTKFILVGTRTTYQATSHQGRRRKSLA